MRALASCPLPAPETCPDGRFLEMIVTLQSTLPSRNQNDVAQAVLVATYRKLLGHFPERVIRYLEKAAVMRCKWFPTVKECLDMIAEVDTTDPLARKRSAIGRLVQSEMQARMDEAMARLASGEADQHWIDGLPENWKSIAETRSLLWRHADGSFTLRRDSSQ